MAFLDVFKKEKLPVYENEQIVAVANGTMVPAEEIKDDVFSQNMLGQTIGFVLEDGDIVAPCNGVLEVLFPSMHAFCVRMENGQGVLVHIGINTVEMNGKGFKSFAKQGDKVKAGQKIVSVNLDEVKEAGYDSVTMLIIAEPSEDGKEETYIDFGHVSRGEVINK